MLFGQLTCLIGIVAAAAVNRQDTPSLTKRPLVHLEYASYAGSRVPSGPGGAVAVDQFLGMRFARPPLRDLRFRAPQEPAYEDQVQDATKLRPVCVGTHDSPSDTFAEDCLFVNVFKPAYATSKSKLPVWVFIQGGGYANNYNGNFNATQVVQQTGGNVVFVGFNYRVGVLGFLASEKVREDGELNAGLLDQRFLLQWVQKYISQFGGDPEHVVIHGDSAGGGSVSYHLTAYGGQDNDEFFIGAIPESPFWPTQRSVADMEFQYSRLLHDTNCDSLACLREVEMHALGNASLPSAFPGSGIGDPIPLWYWLPVIDGHLVQDHMYSLFQSGRFKRVPVLVGDDTNEGTYFAPNAASETEVLSFLRANYPHLEKWQLDYLLGFVYPRMDPMPMHAAYFPTAAAAYGDSTFVCPGNTMADAVSFFVGPDKAWNYRYNVADPDQVAQGLGTPHVSELGAIFGPGNVQGQEPASLKTSNAAIVPVVMAYFTSFVRFLDPNRRRHYGSPEWKNWGSDRQRLRLQTNNTGMEPVPLDLVGKCEVWTYLSTSMEV